MSAATQTSTTVAVTDVGITFSSKRSHVSALEGIDLNVEQGEFVTIAGPSGCGKSTLLKAVAGLTLPTTGSVHLRGSEVTAPRQDIGYVFQRAALLEWRNVRGNILLQAEMRGMDAGTARRRADELIEMTGLKGFEKALPHELSGGMQQRVSLCRALLHEPNVLLMDEPFGALDAITRARLQADLLTIQRVVLDQDVALSAQAGRVLGEEMRRLPEFIELWEKVAGAIEH